MGAHHATLCRVAPVGDRELPPPRFWLATRAPLVARLWRAAAGALSTHRCGRAAGAMLWARFVRDDVGTLHVRTCGKACLALPVAPLARPAGRASRYRGRGGRAAPTWSSCWPGQPLHIAACTFLPVPHFLMSPTLLPLTPAIPPSVAHPICRRIPALSPSRHARRCQACLERGRRS